MKAKLKTSEISRAVKLCVNALDIKDAVRSNIRFEAEDDQLRLMASNNVYSITVSCPCEIEEEGDAVVDGKMAYSVIAKGSGECVFSSDSKSMTIKAIGRTKLPNIEHELPMIDDVKGKSVVFDAVAFKNAYGRIDYAISEDQSRIILTGAHIVSDGEKATLTALDGFRLAQTIIPCEGDAIDIIVPSRILSAICDAITDGKLEIVSNGSRISAVGDRFRINAVTLSGDYIDTARIIPTDFKTNALIQTSNIKDCIDSATVASGASNLVKLILENDSIVVKSNSGEADFQGDVDAMVEGDGLSIAFNLKYLIQAISHITTEQCEMHFNSSVSPVIITPHVNENDDLSLILPVRTFG